MGPCACFAFVADGCRSCVHVPLAPLTCKCLSPPMHVPLAHLTCKYLSPPTHVPLAHLTCKCLSPPMHPLLHKIRTPAPPLPPPQALLAEAGTESLSTRTLVSARVEGWEAAHAFPLATVREGLGQAGELASETAALLAMGQVHDDDQFTPEVGSWVGEGGGYVRGGAGWGRGGAAGVLQLGEG
jgi:hypothetical protein